jgi:hypothetical protein
LSESLGIVPSAIAGMIRRNALVATFVVSRKPSHGLLLFGERSTTHCLEKLTSSFVSQ